MDAHSRRRAALDAIASVVAGTTAGDAETEVVDFKQEAGTIGRGGRQVAIGREHEPAAQALAAEVACMAMSDTGGVIVVGVNDKAAGPEAFVGSHLDLGWLRRRIYALTQPNLSIDIPEEYTVAGKRIYLINVAPALGEIRSGGKLRTRFGTDCVELDGDRARRFLERRRSYDWSAEPSPERLSDCDPAAMKSAHDHYSATRGRPVGSDFELVRRLGVATNDDDDPTLNKAGAVLLCHYEPRVERIDIRATEVDEAASFDRKTLTAPMIAAFDAAWEMIDLCFPARQVVIGAQRRPERPIPERALREALVNAIVHRDYRMPQASIIALAIGRPADTFKVVSPGGFPEGVDESRLLATRSRPRNRVLADAMRVLGLAEREGIGISAMYRTMLRDGHSPPDITASGGDVICRLPGGRVDEHVRGFFDALARTAPRFDEDVRSHIAITELLNSTPLRAEDLAGAAQCSEEEAFEALQRLADAGALERLLNGSRSFRLTASARAALDSRVKYRRRSARDQHWELVRAYLDVNEHIGRAEAAPLLRVSQARASAILSDLYNKRGLIKPVGAARGRGVRYALATPARRRPRAAG
jgi:ATP-dependent DNA helicase RecG